MGLILPPLVFLVILFVIPIGSLLTRSVDDGLSNKVLPKTLAAFERWDKTSDPDEAMFEALYLDLKAADKLDLSKLSTRMNYEKSGWRSLIKITARRLDRIEGPPYKPAMIRVNRRWGDLAFWQSLGASERPGDPGLLPARPRFQV